MLRMLPHTNKIPSQIKSCINILYYAARLVVGPFSLKQQSITMSFESDISHNHLLDNVYEQAGS